MGTTIIILLTILGIAIFFGGAYFMGNYILKSFDDSLQTRIVNTIYGILCWFVIAVVILICFGIYSFVVWYFPVAPDAAWLSK